MQARVFVVPLIAALFGCAESDTAAPGNAFDPFLLPDYPPDDVAWQIADERADADAMITALEQIHDWHTANDTGLELQPALNHGALTEGLSVFPCDVPGELITLWSWRDGESSNRFIWYHRFLSVSDAADEYLRLLTEDEWKAHWIPVFEFEGEWYFVDCEKDASIGSPVSLYFNESGPSYNYVNLTSYLQTMAAAMDRGLLNWNEGWWAGTDKVQDLASVHAEFNEGVSFPYYIPEME
ncbi:MAG: hypothetical protein AAF351_03190 [Pseudomonadota bacterium]